MAGYEPTELYDLHGSAYADAVARLNLFCNAVTTFNLVPGGLYRPAVLAQRGLAAAAVAQAGMCLGRRLTNRAP